MQVCQNCGHRNRPGVVFCENCGASLIGSSPLSTKSFGQKGETATADKDTAKIIESAGAAEIRPRTAFRQGVGEATPHFLQTHPATVLSRRGAPTPSTAHV